MGISDDQMYELMLKMGAKPDDSPGDTGESVSEEQPDAYPKPSTAGEKEDNTPNARWGEEDRKPSENDSGEQQYSNAVLDEFVRGREKFLERHFNAFEPSGETNRKVLVQNLEHAGKGEYDTSSAMYQTPADHTGASKTLPESAKTLVEKTKKVLGHY